ncbi:MAG: type II toxin-antitoxin system RelE/ParE family toxin [Candidatus Omnitrophica bacterium]|nr:type II toxin-antitoxin system RelE/ParE family toxin [Candidatus Omnitrophota bacterium]
MVSFSVEFTSAAARDLRRLDPHIRAELLRAASFLAQAPYPAGGSRIKPLVGPEPPHYRLRIGDYRIVYRIEGNRVIVVRVAHRREAYR